MLTKKPSSKPVNALTTPSIIPADTLESYTSKARDVLGIAKELAITTDSDELEAVNFLKEVVIEGINAVHNALDPICESAHKTHKLAVATRKDLLDPFLKAETTIKDLIEQYQAAKRQKEFERHKELARLSRQAAEQAAMEEVAALIETGDDTSAAILANQIETGELVSSQMLPPMVKSQVSVPAGIAMVEVWRYELLDPLKINREFLVPNESAIAALVKSTKERAETLIGIGSIRVYRELEARRTRG